MPRTTHHAMTSSEDENGNKQRVDIDSRSGKKNRYVKVYMAKRFGAAGMDRNNNTSVVAKFPMNNNVSKTWTEKELQRTQLTAKEAKKFSEFTRVNYRQCPKIEILHLQTGSLDAVSSFSRTRKVGDGFVFEEKLKQFECFIRTNGVSRSRTSSKINFDFPEPRKVQRTVSESSDTEQAFPAQMLNVIPSAPPLEEFPSAFPPLNVILQQAMELQMLNNFGRLALAPDYRPTDPSDSPPTYEKSQADWFFHLIANHVNSPFAYHSNNQTELTQWMYPKEVSVTPLPFDPHRVPTSPVDHPEDSQSQVRFRSESESSAASSSSEDEDDSDVPHPVLHAFVHKFFSESKGQRIISNLQGMYDPDVGYTLTTPTVHSIDKSFGERDEGQSGMKLVIDNHKCTRLCRHFPDMHQLFEKARTGRH